MAPDKLPAQNLPVPTYDQIDDLGYQKIIDAKDAEIERLKAEIKDLSEAYAREASNSRDRDGEVICPN